jgi:hypothetical protein
MRTRYATHSAHTRSRYHDGAPEGDINKEAGTMSEQHARGAGLR